MTRAPEVDAQWATVRAARHADVKPHTSHDPNLSSPLLVMHAAAVTVEAAQRRKAALKITDMAAVQHPCELDPDNNASVCTHPDHERDVDWARMALDVLGLDAHPDNETHLDVPEQAPERARLTRSAFTRPDWRWQDDAACRGEDLILFFGPDGERGPDREIRERKAKQICFGCPARTGCLDYAVSRPEKYGIYGGLNEDERAPERRRRMRKAA